MSVGSAVRRHHVESHVVAATTLGASFTLFAIAPWIPVRFGYPIPGVAVFVTALASMSALSVAVLFFMRQRRSPHASDAVVALLFGITALLEIVLPVLAEIEPDTVGVAFWSRVTGRSVVAGGLCAAAWLPARLVVRRISGRTMLAAVVGGAAVVVASVAVRLSAYPSVADSSDLTDALIEDGTLRGIRLAGTLLLLAAAVGFVRRARLLGDELFRWLAAGAVLLAAARFHDFLFPSVHVDWLTTADILRVAAQLVLVAAALRELAVLFTERGAEVRERERRRLAAELHDGLAQELAYLTTHSALAESDPTNAQHLANVRAAAERALSETRLTIATYARAGHVSLDRVITKLATDIQTRYGCQVMLDVGEVVVDERTAHELGRLAGEAMGNAARHANTGRIFVRLGARTGMVRLTVTDNGAGIADDCAHRTKPHFGLTSMHERAERLGGRCSIVSAPARGTTVAVEVPQR